MGNCFVLAAEEIVAVMDGPCGVQRGDPAAEERRRAALVLFIGAGMPLTLPSLRCRQRRWLAPRDRDAPGATWPCTYGWPARSDCGGSGRTLPPERLGTRG
jgi:hypothetical protein